ncbi:MAG: glycosyltransferase [bacterium]|nr:glycosyltransferase [bacterium]
MRKYLFAVADYPPRIGGAARYHAAVARALGSAVAVHPVRLERHWIRLPLELAQAARTHSAGVLLVGEVLPVGTAAYALRVLTRVPYAVICHGLDLRNALHTPRKRWLVRRVLRGAERVIVNSTFTERLAVACGARPAQIRIVLPPLGITPELAKPAQVANVRDRAHLERTRIILSVGRLVARKGFDTLIRATSLLRRELPLAGLVIIGDGPERARLEALARAEHLAVRFLTTTNDTSLAAWYAACDVFALLPRELPDGDVEGFGMVYLEAGAFGKPVVGTRSGGVPEAIHDGETGVLVPPEDPVAACAALARLLRDPRHAQRLGANGASAAAHRNAQFNATLCAALV